MIDSKPRRLLNNMPLTPTPSSQGAPTIGLSDVFQRNTELDTATQQVGFKAGPRIPPFGQWDAGNIGDTSHYPTVSQSWADWFEGGQLANWPTGKPQQFVTSPDPTGIVTAVQSGRGAMYPGHTWIRNFAGDYSTGHWTATGKMQQPYAPS